MFAPCAAVITCTREGSFDFLAAYVVPENAWYIIPAKLIDGKGCDRVSSECDEPKI